MKTVSDLQEESTAKRAVLSQMNAQQAELTVELQRVLAEIERLKKERGVLLLDGEHTLLRSNTPALASAEQSARDIELQLPVLAERILVLAGQIADCEIEWRKLAVREADAQVKTAEARSSETVSDWYMDRTDMTRQAVATARKAVFDAQRVDALAVQALGNLGTADQRNALIRSLIES